MISFPNFKTEGGGGQINIPKKTSKFSVDASEVKDTAYEGGEIKIDNKSEEILEDPYKFSKDQIGMSEYESKSFRISTRMGAKLDEINKTLDEKFVQLDAVRSLFNPFNAVNVKGIPSNTPLLNKDKTTTTSDCTIKTLVDLSNQENCELGRGIFKYVDFMYCNDLGKISNNHLITLRRFAFPVGDNIVKFQKDKTDPSYVAPDVGRMITWFDTDDNKLENILSYSYDASWKSFTSERERVDTMSDTEGRDNILQKLTNGFSKSYNSLKSQGVSGSNDILSEVGASVFHLKKTGDIDTKFLTDYDAHKVYTPLNVIDSTNLYEGRLKFTHSIKLVFKYKLRAYNGINPKAAFLDLLGNIMVVTYRRGKFWGGSRVYVGPVPNNSVFDIAQSFVDNKTEKIKDIFSDFVGNGDIMGTLSNVISSFGWNDVTDLYKKFSIASGGNGNVKEDATRVGKGFISTIGSMVKNTLGRPQVYALNSLLSGADVGFWHLTIGNPRNPIASIGNLILKNATITHSGALGIDDFPSELKVEVTLEHGRPRDSAAIERMYTRGMSTIYFNYADSLLPQNQYQQESGEKFTLGQTVENFVDTDKNGQLKTLRESFGDDDVQVLQRIIEEMA